MKKVMKKVSVEKAEPKKKAAAAAAEPSSSPGSQGKVEQQKEEFEDARIKATAEYGVTAGFGPFQLR